MRSVLLALFGTFAAAVMAALLLATATLKLPPQVISKALCVMLLLVFGNMGQQASEYWGTFWRRSTELEAKLDYSQCKAKTYGHMISITSATGLLCLGILRAHIFDDTLDQTKLGLGPVTSKRLLGAHQDRFQFPLAQGGY